MCLRALEAARNAKTIGKSLEAKVVLHFDGSLAEQIGLTLDELATVFIVSQVEVTAEGAGSYQGTVPFLPGLTIEIAHADGAHCPRCWVYSDTVGKDARASDALRPLRTDHRLIDTIGLRRLMKV